MLNAKTLSKKSLEGQTTQCCHINGCQIDCAEFEKHEYVFNRERVPAFSTTRGTVDISEFRNFKVEDQISENPIQKSALSIHPSHPGVSLDTSRNQNEHLGDTLPIKKRLRNSSKPGHFGQLPEEQEGEDPISEEIHKYYNQDMRPFSN